MITADVNVMKGKLSVKRFVKPLVRLPVNQRERREDRNADAVEISRSPLFRY
jgi:hypothetical protein